jgi:hypothetical protein
MNQTQREDLAVMRGELEDLSNAFLAARDDARECRRLIASNARFLAANPDLEARWVEVYGREIEEARAGLAECEARMAEYRPLVEAKKAELSAYKAGIRAGL